MSIPGLGGSSQSHSNAAQDYDHAIVLVDTSNVRVDPEDTTEDDSRTASGAPLSRRWTKGTLREELARRKYSKWQEEKEKDGENTAEASDDAGKGSPREGTAVEAKESTPSPERSGRLRDRLPFRSKKQLVKSKGTDNAFVDVLYENQRGAFFCGIPLYSGNSLLNFDPSPWQTSTFQDSPVNITNAQLPDPSWGWAWRTWYVDMSYDVDEEGWQYSFNFKSGFAWHGTHPWFHSFVRRRRWLRKRVKIHPPKTSGGVANIKDAHLLTVDYFTIHASRDRSRGSSAERTTNNRSSFLSKPQSESESDGELDTSNVGDILKLMALLKRSRVDREKLSVVNAFLDQGGDDLIYLADKMTEIMGLFIYETSRRQLQSSLLRAFDQAKTQQRTSTKDADLEDEALTGKADLLLKALRAANENFNDEWSNSKAGAKQDDPEDPDTSQGSEGEKGSLEAIGKDAEDDQAGDELGAVRDEIKGIPGGAEISEEPSIGWDTENQPSTVKPLDKGKGRAE